MTWLNKLWTYMTFYLGPHSLFSIVRNSWARVWSHFHEWEHKTRKGLEEGNFLSSSLPNLSLALCFHPLSFFIFFARLKHIETLVMQPGNSLISAVKYVVFICYIPPFGSAAFVCTLSSLLEEVASFKCLVSLHSSTLSSVCPSVPSWLWH